jgi:hypothetical protein
MNQEWFDTTMRTAISTFELAFAILMMLGVLATVAAFVLKRVRAAFPPSERKELRSE